MKHRGFTFIEMMIVLFSLSFIFLLTFDLLIALRRGSEIDMGINQLDIFKLQFQHEVMLGSNFRDENGEICYTRLDKEFCIACDGERLIKTPGYEILLNQLSDISIDLSQESLDLVGNYEGEYFEESFTIYR